MNKLILVLVPCTLFSYINGMEQVQGDISSWRQFTHLTSQELSYAMSQLSKADQDMTKSQVTHVHRNHDTMSLYEAILWDTVVEMHMQYHMKQCNVSNAMLLPQSVQDELFANARTEYALRIQELNQPLADDDGQQE